MKNHNFWKIEERNIYDFISLFAFILILLGGCFLTYYYITEKINSCTADPLKFTANKIAEQENMQYDYIVFYLYGTKESMPFTTQRIINLKNDSDNFSIKK